MQKHDYPFLEQQKTEHENFLLTFDTLRVEIASLRLSRVFMMFRVQIFLFDWIVNHTQKEDMHFGRYLMWINK